MRLRAARRCNVWIDARVTRGRLIIDAMRTQVGGLLAAAALLLAAASPRVRAAPVQFSSSVILFKTHVSTAFRAAGQQGSRAAGQQGSRAAGQQGSRAAGQQGSRAAGQQGSRAAGQQGSRAAGQQGSRAGRPATAGRGHAASPARVAYSPTPPRRRRRRHTGPATPAAAERACQRALRRHDPQRPEVWQQPDQLCADPGA
jgi:hypothetical protein